MSGFRDFAEEQEWHHRRLARRPRLGFTGTRRGLSPVQRAELRRLLLELRPVEFHHGDCIGADAQAHELVRELCIDCRIVLHPPDVDVARERCTADEERRPRPYLKRNEEIVAESDLVVACPATPGEVLRSGTWATVRRARAAEVPCRVMAP